jgi:hypothetical protein
MHLSTGKIGLCYVEGFVRDKMSFQHCLDDTANKVRQPVFLIGCPRSGTTITFDLLCSHADFAWLSTHVNNRSKELAWSWFVRLYSFPGIGRWLYLKKDKFGGYLPLPAEAWIFWTDYLRNFRWRRTRETFPRRRTAEDISAAEIATIRISVDKVCSFQGKHRFIAKYTDFPRIKYLTQAFPDAKFIHIIRDGRAVANSWCKMMQRGKMRAWDERDWWIRGWPEEWRKKFKREAYTPLGFVAYQWKFFLREIWADAEALPSSQYLEVYYRDLMANPTSTLERLLSFCGADVTSRVAWYIKHMHLGSRNWKWQQLDRERKTILNEIVKGNGFTQLLD